MEYISNGVKFDIKNNKIHNLKENNSFTKLYIENNEIIKNNNEKNQIELYIKDKNKYLENKINILNSIATTINNMNNFEY